MNQKILSSLSAVCACGLAVFAAGCSPEWIAGEAPDTPPGAFKADPVVPESKAGLTSADYSDAQFASLPPPASGPADTSYDLSGFTLKEAPGKPAEKSREAVFSAPADVPAAVPSKSKASAPAPASDSKDIKYVVQVNDTLSGIAYIYGVPADELAAHNGLTAKSTIKPGQVLYIPTDKISSKGTQTVDQVKASGFQPLDKAAEKTTAPAASSGTAAAAAAGSTVTYTVVAGDSLGKIGQKFHVNYMKIAKANNMDPNATLYVGKKLIIPDPKTIPDTAKAAPSKKKSSSKSTAAKSASKTEAPAEVKSADKSTAAAPEADAAEKKAKSDEPSDTDIFGDESATSTDAPASAPATAESAARETVAEKAPENAEPEVPQGPADPPDIFQYNLTSESTLKSICKSMHYKEDTVLKLNPGISMDERLGAGRSITLPMIPDDL